MNMGPSRSRKSFPLTSATRLLMRVLSPSAARSVNVKATICDGSTPSSIRAGNSAGDGFGLPGTGAGNDLEVTVPVADHLFLFGRRSERRWRKGDGHRSPLSRNHWLVVCSQFSTLA